MPPRSARRASARKPASKAKNSTPPPSNSSPIATPEAADLEVEALPPPFVKEEEITEDEVTPSEESGFVVKSEIKEETEALKIGEDEAAEKNNEEEAVADKVQDSVDLPLGEGREDPGEGEEADEKETEKEMEVQEEAAAADMVLDSEELPLGEAHNHDEREKEKEGEMDVKQGAAAAEKVQFSSGPPIEEAHEDGRSQEDSSEGEETDEEEEEEMDSDVKDDKQMAEVELREGNAENISGGGVDGVGNEGVDDVGDDNVSDGDTEDEEDEEDDSALYVRAPLTERKKQKELEIFVGGLDKGAVEEDLVKVFGVFGEIQSVRIVKHPVTQKSKGFAFISYVSIEHAKKALAELNNGTKVKGKQIRVSASQDNDTLYLGNICKSWTKDHVIETLKGYGIEQIEHILIPDDPRKEGKIKGFAFLEFSSHSNAMAAFHRLRKPDAVFGRDVSAKVAFSQTPLHPSEEALSQVKTVYIAGIPKSWDEVKVRELCKEYGEIEKIHLSQNSTSTKRKDFGFVEFACRDNAIACVEGINNTQLVIEDVNVKANLAKPVNKGWLAKKSAQGGVKVKKDGEAAAEVGQSKKKKKKAKSKVQDKEVTWPKSKNSSESMPSKSHNKNFEGRKGHQTAQSAKGKKRGRRGMDIVANEQASKKARNSRNQGKMQGRYSSGFGNRRDSYSSKPYAPHQTAFAPHQTAYAPHQTAYAPRYAPPPTSYMTHAYAGTSGSQQHRSDLEPHAGYLPAANQVRNPYEYELRRSGAYDSQARSSGYAGASSMQSSHPGYSTYPSYKAGYTYPSSEAYGYRGRYY